MPSDSKNKSRLLEKLREAERGRPAAFGFGRVAEETSKAPTFLILAEAKANAAAIAELVAAGAHAILIEPSGVDGAQDSLEELAKAAGDAPIGLTFHPDRHLSGSAAAGISATSADFVVLPIERAPVEAMDLENVGRIARIESTLEPALLRGLNELDIDAVAAVATHPRPSAEALTIFDLMHLRQIADFTRHPTLVVAEQTIGPAALQQLRDAGVLGVILTAQFLAQTGQPAAATVKAFHEAAAKIERKKQRRDGDLPSLPAGGTNRPFGGGDEPEPDDGDDEE